MSVGDKKEAQVATIETIRRGAERQRPKGRIQKQMGGLTENTTAKPKSIQMMTIFGVLTKVKCVSGFASLGSHVMS